MTDNEKFNLSGRWRGQYFYPQTAGWATPEPTVFEASISEVSGSFTGTTTENSMGSQLTASLDGNRAGTIVNFIKWYQVQDENFDHVLYEGELSDQGNKLVGKWTIPGQWSGSFTMTRDRLAKLAKEKKVSV